MIYAKYTNASCTNHEKSPEINLGLIVGDDLKWIGHMDRILWKANMIFGMLKRKFERSQPRL